MKKTFCATTCYQYQLFFSALLGGLLIASFALPTNVSALEATSQTRQLLPLTGNSCASVSTTSFTPYVYDGALHSFEFTVSDPSYVAISGSVGDSSIPFHLMTRKMVTSGVRIHVDVEPISTRGPLPVQVTLLSARAGQPVCLTSVSVDVGSGAAVSEASVVPARTVSSVQPTPPIVTTLTERVSDTLGEREVVDMRVATTSAIVREVEISSATTTVPTSGVIRNFFGSICTSDAGAYRLWLIILVLFTIVVGAALWAEFPMALPWARTPERVATFILVLLLVLLVFWYLSVSCRAALWIPLAAFLVATIGLLAAFWNHPRVTQLLLAQAPKG